MKQPERTVLGHLLAFTLGIVCMGVIALVLMRSKTSPSGPLREIPEPPQSEASTPPQPEPRRQSFQRIPRAIAPPVIEGSVVEKSAPAAPATPAENIVEESPQVVVVPVAQPMAVHSGPTVATASAGGGRLSGKVTFSGSPPPEKNLPLSDPYCTAQVEKGLAPGTTRFYVQGKDRALADVVVSVVGISRRGSSFQRKVIVEQGCNFEPYIAAASVGQKIVVQNRDRTMHSLRLESKENGELHRNLLPGSFSSFQFELKAPEDFIRIRCEVHPWEFAYVSAFDHPFFAVTDKNGAFVIEGIPPGRYTVQAHHRKAGVVTKEVQIESYRNADLQFVLEIAPTQTAALQ